jgi:tRNA(His) guanylyltransferase
MKDDFGDRMKYYESSSIPGTFMPMIPVCVRADGRNFSKFTRNMKRPYDPSLITCMRNTTRELVESSNATIGYTQSDEITLIFLRPSWNSEIFFNGKKQKIISVIASATTAFFNNNVPKYLSDYNLEPAMFDCRAWQVPNLTEAANVILWREMDASRNSISMLAQSHFSHTTLQNLSTKQMQEKLMTEKDINWNDEPYWFKKGSYFHRVKRERILTDEEYEAIPVSYRPDRNIPQIRSSIEELVIPKLSSIQNKEDVLFKGADPILLESKDDN